MFSIKCICGYNTSKIIRPLLAALSVDGLNQAGTIITEDYDTEVLSRLLYIS